MAISELMNQQSFPNTRINQQHKNSNMTDQSEPRKPEESESFDNVFSSVDFGRFLSKDFTTGPGSPFVSKDNSFPSFDVPSILQSKDAFSQMFSSSDWQMKFSKPTSKGDAADVPRKKTIPPSVVAPAAPSENTSEEMLSVLSSRDWMASGYLGPHVDVSINRDMLTSTSSDDSISPRTVASDISSALPQARTDWDNIFFSQMQLMPTQPEPSPTPSINDEEPTALAMDMMPSGAIGASELSELEEEEHAVKETSFFSSSIAAVRNTATAATQAGKKKRKRKPRKKVIPKVKVYVEPTENDVLLGRGGRSNNHPGNKRYREEVRNLRTWYLSIGDNKEEKTAIAQCLVDYVHNYKGRFLEKDKTGWYEVANIVARRKASQALREDEDPEKRAAKRERFLKKRAVAQQREIQGV